MANSSLSSRRSVETPSVSCSACYRSDAAVAQYCDAHYGPDKFGVANFSAQIVNLCVTTQAERPKQNALDLGCSVGRTSFELARHFDRVTGIDYSTRFIDIARHIKKHGKICYRLQDEGDLISDHKVSLNDFDLAATTPRVSFYQGDVQCLESHFRDYDLVLAANLIDRLPNPGIFLADIHQRLVMGGLLVIASPYNWLEHFTPRKHWLCHRFHLGGSQTSLEGLKMKLTKHFTMIGKPREVEFVIRDTARTFHHSISQLTFWRRFY